MTESEKRNNMKKLNLKQCKRCSVYCNHTYTGLCYHCAKNPMWVGGYYELTEREFELCFTTESEEQSCHTQPLRK